MTYKSSEGPIISQYPLAVGNLMTRVLDCGSGETTVVCLHGAGSRADRFWHNLGPVAAAGHRVIAVDFPGHGFATKGPETICTASAYAAFTLDVLRTLHIDRAVLVGTSLGGHVAARIAVDRPESVAGLVLIGALGIVPAEQRATPSVPMWEASPEAVRGKLRMVVADPALITEAWVHEESRINSSPGARDALRVVAEYLASGVDRDRVGDQLRERVGTVPMLLVWGAEDRWVPPSVGRQAQQLLAGSPLEVMPGTGHAPYYEDPGTFNRLLLTFLQGLPNAGALGA